MKKKLEENYYEKQLRTVLNSGRGSEYGYNFQVRSDSDQSNWMNMDESELEQVIDIFKNKEVGSDKDFFSQEDTEEIENLRNDPKMSWNRESIREDVSGLTNRKTWLVNLHFGDEAIHWVQGARSLSDVIDRMRNDIETMVEEASEGITNPFIKDLLSVGDVNWAELARNYWEEYKDEVIETEEDFENTGDEEMPESYKILEDLCDKYGIVPDPKDVKTFVENMGMDDDFDDIVDSGEDEIIMSGEPWIKSKEELDNLVDKLHRENRTMISFRDAGTAYDHFLEDLVEGRGVDPDDVEESFYDTFDFLERPKHVYNHENDLAVNDFKDEPRRSESYDRDPDDGKQDYTDHNIDVEDSDHKAPFEKMGRGFKKIKKMKKENIISIEENFCIFYGCKPFDLGKFIEKKKKKNDKMGFEKSGIDKKGKGIKGHSGHIGTEMIKPKGDSMESMTSRQMKGNGGY